MFVDIALGAMSSIFVGMVMAILLGKLVPKGRLDDKAKEAEKWEAAYKEIKASSEQKDRLMERLVMTADITDKIMATVRAETSRSN